jgi:hypothetical protein
VASLKYYPRPQKNYEYFSHNNGVLGKSLTIKALRMQSRYVRHLSGSIGLLFRRLGSNVFDDLPIRGKFIPCLDKNCVLKAYVSISPSSLNLSTDKYECLPPEQWPLGTHKIRGVISKCI